MDTTIVDESNIPQNMLRSFFGSDLIGGFNIF